ncbi:MAG TPA: YdcH family protein [Sphingomicrobium sp.]
MTVQAFRLMEAHQRIDERLRLESGRRWPDPFKIMRLKKLKLRIKDRLNGFLPKLRGAAR